MLWLQIKWGDVAVTKDNLANFKKFRWSSEDKRVKVWIVAKIMGF